MKRLPSDTENSRDQILDAAEKAFAADGFGSTALSAIAEAAGVAKSLIHHHFRSKEGLWHAVLARRFAEYATLQDEILSRPAAAAADFRDSVPALFHFLERNPDFARLHAWTNAGDGSAPGLGSELTRRGVSRLRELQKTGELRDDVDPAAVLAAYFALVEHWFQARASLQERFGSEAPDDPTYLDTILRILIDGIRP